MVIPSEILSIVHSKSLFEDPFRNSSRDFSRNSICLSFHEFYLEIPSEILLGTNHFWGFLQEFHLEIALGLPSTVTPSVDYSRNTIWGTDYFRNSSGDSFFPRNTFQFFEKFFNFWRRSFLLWEGNFSGGEIQFNWLLTTDNSFQKFYLMILKEHFLKVSLQKFLWGFLQKFHLYSNKYFWGLFREFRRFLQKLFVEFLLKILGTKRKKKLVGSSLFFLFIIPNNSCRDSSRIFPVSPSVDSSSNFICRVF